MLDLNWGSMVSVTAPNKNTGSPPARQGICVLGATGSIGRSTLDVIARHPERYQVVALAANSRVKELAELAASSGAKYVALGDAGHQRQLRDELARLGVTPKVLIGPAGVAESAALDEVDTVMAAIVGAAGLKATLDAARHGKRVLLANKEALVMAGAIFMEIVRSNRAELLPIDSEHNAIFQCLPANGASISPRGVKKIILTASGGPFRGQPREALREVTPDQACAHPTWRMGRKISVDSATMMNKGLEIIEAHWLFDVPKNDIEVVIHPQSVIHSMVEYLDGSVIAQLGNPDMRTPIAQALAFPERIEAGVKSLNLMDIGALTFENPDMSAFPALSLAYEALHLGGCAPAVLNAANEIAVDAFLSGGLRFLDITTVIEKTMNLAPATRLECLDDVLAVDEWARRLAGEQVATLRGAL